MNDIGVISKNFSEFPKGTYVSFDHEDITLFGEVAGLIVVYDTHLGYLLGLNVRTVGGGNVTLQPSQLTRLP
jgi:hypothetical protein